MSRIIVVSIVLPLPSNRHHLSYDDCVEEKKENYQNSSVLCCVWQLCPEIRTRIWAVLKDGCCFRFRFCFLCICLGLAFCVFFWFSLDYFVLVFFAFWCVTFSFFSTVPRDWLGRTSPKWPILCRVGRGTSTQPINQSVVLLKIVHKYSLSMLRFCHCFSSS